MNPRTLEPFGWAAALAILSALIAHEAIARSELERQLPLDAKELYQAIGSAQLRLQIVDVRADLDEYEDTHIPGAIPLPGCDPAKAPPGAAERVLASVPTVIVSADGDLATYQSCAERFTQARNLAGGLDGWVGANLPEDSGEYVPPKPAAGGGCL